MATLLSQEVEQSDTVVVSRYEVDRGVGGVDTTEAVEPTITVYYMTVMDVMDDQDPPEQLLSGLGKPVHRKAKGGHEFQLILNGNNPAHLTYIADLLTAATTDVVVGAGDVDLDDALSQAGERLLADWWAGTIQCGASGNYPTPSWAS